MVLYILVREDKVEKDNKIVFYDLLLILEILYVGYIKVWNEVGLEVIVILKYIWFDFILFMLGVVKWGLNWFKEFLF